MVLSCPDIWPQLRHETFRAPSTIYVGVTYIPISVLHDGYIHEELTRFLSHIHQENYKLLVFCEKTQTIPLFILISERAE